MAHEWGRRATGCLVLLGLLSLLGPLYVLSIGPAALYASMTGQKDAVRRVYAPVIWLHDHTPLKTSLEKYVELWE